MANAWPNVQNPPEIQSKGESLYALASYLRLTMTYFYLHDIRYVHSTF